jgi:hypothetical protein
MDTNSNTPNATSKLPIQEINLDIEELEKIVAPSGVDKLATNHNETICRVNG